MRRRAVMLAGAAALVTMPVSLRAQAPSAALHAWVEAFNSRDPRRIVALYARDSSAQPPAHGTRPWTRVAIDAQHERVYGDTAIVSGAYTFSDVRDGVATNMRPARFTFVFRRDGNGWLIVDHHSSRVPEP